MTMTAPTLVYSGTTTLPHPVAARQSPGFTDVTNTTLLGYRRVQRMFVARAWTLEFAGELLTDWAAIKTVWDAAVAANEFPAFSYSDLFADASAVDVAVELSEFTPLPGAVTVGSFTLTLTQQTPD